MMTNNQNDTYSKLLSLRNDVQKEHEQAHRVEYINEARTTREAKDKVRRINETYARQQAMYKRCNHKTTELIKNITPMTPIEQVLVQAIDLIGDLLDDKATAMTLKNRLKDSYDLE